jgi:hypothetical protein
MQAQIRQKRRSDVHIHTKIDFSMRVRIFKYILNSGNALADRREIL